MVILTCLVGMFYRTHFSIYYTLNSCTGGKGTLQGATGWVLFIAGRNWFEQPKGGCRVCVLPVSASFRGFYMQKCKGNCVETNTASVI